MTRILGVCFRSREGAVAENVERAERVIREAARENRVDLVVLPELFTSGYCAPDLTPWAEDEGSETFRRFAALARELDTVIGWGFAGRGDGRRVYNSYAVIEPGRPPAIVRKTHLHRSQPGSPIDEPAFLLPGDQLGLVDTRLGRLGVMICYDGCFVEVPRTLVLQGADVILWPSRSGTYLAGTGFPRMRAIDNIASVVQVEGSQDGPHLPLHGLSQVFDHAGELLAECRDDDGVLSVELDFAAGRRCREAAVNVWAQYRVRRPELYGPLTRV